MIRKVYLLLLFCLGFYSYTFAQTIVKGKITSSSDNLPVVGATIIPNDDIKAGISSDFDGNFTLKLIKDSGVLKISSIGFQTKEISYNGKANLTIVLTEASDLLNEVVLIGYGTSKKGDVTSAISKVENIESISSRPVNNLTDFLQGNTPGVTVLSNGGDPTSPGKVVIRGLGSVNSDSESVLTIVDGVPYYGPPINPNDIASVSVLKDAAASSIYGALASSGVIVIETKKGKKGKPRISIDAYTGFRQATNLPTALNAKQQSDVYNLAATNAGLADGGSAHNVTLNPWGQITRTNWIDEIFRSAITTNLNANVSGGGDNYNFLTSFGYNNTDGVLLGTTSNRYSFRVKSDIDLSDKLTIGENVYFSQTNALGTDTSSGYSGTIINAIYMPSAASVRDEKGLFSGVVPFNLSKFAGAYGDVFNPVALLLRPTQNRPSTYVNANVYLSYKILENLKFKSSFSYATTHDREKIFNPKIPEIGRTNLTNSLLQSSAVENRWIWDNQLSYIKSFGNHNLNATAIHSAQFTDYEFLEQRGENFGSEESFNQFLGNASTIRPPVTEAYERALRSIIGRIMYNYNQRYYLSASVRQDESSRLFKTNQKDEFYSGTLAWRISNESFFNSKVIDDLKLRASFGQQGNINSVESYAFDVPLSSDIEIIGANGPLDRKSIFERIQSNPDLRWETSESVNIGLDVTLLNNSLSFTADYFEKRTKNMLLPDNGDIHIGLDPRIVNSGEVLNNGFELAINYKNNIGDLNFNINANGFSLFKNELVSLIGDRTTFDLPITNDTSVRQQLTPFKSKVGEELFSYFLIPQEGIFQNQAEIDAHVKDGSLIQPNAVPGDFKFTDTDGDGTITLDDRVYMGSYQPDFTYNLGLNLDYKGFDLNLIFQGVTGSKVFNGYKYSTYNASLQGYNLDNSVLNAWSPTNTNTNIPILSTSDANNNFGTNSSWYLEDASYLRLKNITFGYSIPKQSMNKLLKGSSLRIYFSAENVFTITDYTGIDPEVGGFGLDVARFPLSRTFTTGISLKL